MDNSNKKCLVTGGAGFIGSNLVDALIGKGFRVAVIDNLSSGKREYLNGKAKFYETDITDREAVENIFLDEKPDYVFHLAAQISVKDSVADPVFDNQVNAVGSFKIFELSNKHDIKKLVFISTGGALYGDVTEPARENMVVSPVSPYAIHKFTAERYLALFRTEYGLNSIVLRLANVYGPRQFKGGEGAAVAVFTHNVVNDIESTIFGDGSKTRDYIYVGDVVEACLAAIASDCQGTVNIGTAKKISVHDLLETIEGIAGKAVGHQHAKDRPGEVQDSILDNTLAKEKLDWKPAFDLTAGIAKTLSWTKEQGVN